MCLCIVTWVNCHTGGLVVVSGSLAISWRLLHRETDESAHGRLLFLRSIVWVAAVIEERDTGRPIFRWIVIYGTHITVSDCKDGHRALHWETHIPVCCYMGRLALGSDWRCSCNGWRQLHWESFMLYRLIDKSWDLNCNDSAALPTSVLLYVHRDCREGHLEFHRARELWMGSLNLAGNLY